MHIAVLGTGIVGACTAAWLQRDGHRITFVSPTPPGEACSFGNAGSLSPSACLPVGMPGMWKQVPGWLRDPDGPLRIAPAYLLTVLPWLLRFLRASSPGAVVHSASAMRGLLAPIFESYAPLLAHAQAEHLVRRSGCLYVYSSQQAAGKWQWGMNLRRQLGVDLRDVDEAALAELEPDLRGRFRFGILAPDNGSTVDPSALVKALHARCVADGAQNLHDAAIGFDSAGDRVTAVRLLSGAHIECDGVVVATGAWSGSLARSLGLNVTSARRHPMLPDVPTMAETGVPGLAQFEAASWQGLFAPAGLPPGVMAKLNAEVVKAMDSADIKEFFGSQGFIVGGTSPEQFRALIDAEVPKWGRVIKAGNIKID